MKRYIKPINLLLALIMLFFSCDVLDQEPNTQIDIEKTIPITDEASARAALTGLYDALQDFDYYGVYFTMNVDMFTDDVFNTAFKDSYKQLNSQYVPTTNETVKLVWAQMYRTINAANHIITSVPLIPAKVFKGKTVDEVQSIKDEITGAAEMIRGMTYLDLLRTYGEHWNLNSTYGVPLLTTPVTKALFTPRSTVAQTYQRIIADLQSAEQKLPNTSDPVYVSQRAATALLARAYLYMRDYANAESHATIVINSGQYELMANYGDVYNTNNTRESIFELNFNDQDPNGLFNQFSQTDEASITYDLYAVFDEMDTRINTIIPGLANPYLWTTSKYIKQDDNAYLIRLAEMYTIRAEALALGLSDISGALEDLNRLRWRANLSSLQLADVPNTDSFIEALLLEKRKEFYAEGHRFFDLARFQMFDKVYGIENFRSIFPIPYIEIITARNLGVTMTQNPGY